MRRQKMMSATDPQRASRATPGSAQVASRPDGVAFNHDGVHGASLLFVDMRVRSLLMREARRGVVTRVFGVPGNDQSFLATMIFFGAAATVLRGVAPRPWPRPTGADAKIGGSLVNAAFRGIAGAPSRTMPLAGGLIAFALLSHSLRPAVAGSAREVHALAREVRAALGARYGH
jgi:hypothetical protein